MAKVPDFSQFSVMCRNNDQQLGKYNWVNICSYNVDAVW